MRRHPAHGFAEGCGKKASYDLAGDGRALHLVKIEP
jgi:hypothetical protein